jgi:polyhydroxybutyrate depolymerase
MRKNQRISLLCLSLGLAVASHAQTVVDSILQDGIYRTYRLYAPPGFAASENPALVFNLHGLGSNAEQQEAYSRMNLVAEGERFLICYVNGVNNSWNLGLGQVDDIGLIGALIDRFVLTHGVDDQRVYSCGMSQGGFFSFRLACELPERIAAIGTGARDHDQRHRRCHRALYWRRAEHCGG